MAHAELEGWKGVSLPGFQKSKSSFLARSLHPGRFGQGVTRWHFVPETLGSDWRSTRSRTKFCNELRHRTLLSVKPRSWPLKGYRNGSGRSNTCRRCSPLLLNLQCPELLSCQEMDGTLTAVLLSSDLLSQSERARILAI